MSLHIQATKDQIASSVLISGDPLRAKYVAEKILTDVICYNEVRGMLGFTGMYNGKRVSVQGTGMGIPSTGIYVHELIHGYGVKKIIRVGTCGALQADLELGTLILAEAAYTDSNTQLLYYDSMEYTPSAGSDILQQARDVAEKNSIEYRQGIVFSTDTFYDETPHRWDPWIKRGVLAIEMETSIIYSLAAKNNIQALSILTVSDNIITNTSTSTKEREQISLQMMKLALEIA
jgi:purine-nucleoside phosphorylase